MSNCRDTLLYCYLHYSLACFKLVLPATFFAGLTLLIYLVLLSCLYHSVMYMSCAKRGYGQTVARVRVRVRVIVRVAWFVLVIHSWYRQSMDCTRQFMDCTTQFMDCTTQFMDCPNLCFVHNIYTLFCRL